MSKNELARRVGVSVSGLFKIETKLAEEKLITRGDKGAVKSTQFWVESTKESESKPSVKSTEQAKSNRYKVPVPSVKSTDTSVKSTGLYNKNIKNDSEMPKTDGGKPIQKGEKPLVEKANKATTDEDRLNKLPIALGKTPISRLVSIYNLKFKKLYGFDYVVSSWPRLAKQFKPLLDQFNEYQVASLILLHFDWHGATGTDDFNHKRLAEKCFPLEWIPRGVNEYRAFILNSLQVNFEDVRGIREHVIGQVKSIKK